MSSHRCRTIFLFCLLIAFVSCTHIRSSRFNVPDIPQYIENLVPNDVAENYPVIRLNLGYIRGNWLHSASSRRYAAYKGIPYAQPPLADLRFQPPQEKKPWYGVRDTLNHGPQCPQQLFLLNRYVGHEDCLYLNLYVPQPEGRGNEPRNYKDELLPIIFFIHGGSWVVGAGDMDNYLYGPDRIMDEDVILVTINYRLGAMGFLYLENKVPGNMGLKDQAMALRLIKANARSFGGDPNRIVLMGESAGGASAEYHTLNPESRKLISGVIAQSGSVLSAWAWSRPAVLARRTRRLAKFLNCPNDSNPDYIMDCLKSADPRNIVKYQLYTDWSPVQLLIGASFTPTIEPAETYDPFLRDCPRNLLGRLKESSKQVPYLTGYNTAEGQLFTKIAVSLLDSVIQFVGKGPLGLPREPTTVEYLKKKPHITQPSPKLIDNLLGDYEFKAPVIDSSRHHANAGSNVYLYHFSFIGKNNFARLFWNNPAPTHMDELTYLFQGRGLFAGLPQFDDESSEAAVSQRLIRLWTNFAKTGSPTPLNNTGIDIDWPLGPSKILTIGEKLSVRNSPLKTGWSSFLDNQCVL